MQLREQLITARPEAKAYAESLHSLPNCISEIKGRIGAITIYPIKSLGGLHLQDGASVRDIGLVTEDGNYADRSAVIALRKPGVTEGQPYEYVRFTQREEGKLSLPTPRYDGKKRLTYSAEGMPDLTLIPEDLNPSWSKKRVHVKLSSEIQDGVCEKGNITAWIRTFLKKVTECPRYDIDDIEVLITPVTFKRDVENKHSRSQDVQTLYSDGGQVLVTSSSTLSWMNGYLRKQYGKSFRTISMEAFRPNIVLDELPPNVEDVIGRISFQGKEHIRMLFGGMSVRCDVTRVDPRTGNKPDKEPLRWLKAHRPPRLDAPHSTTFGVNTVFPVMESAKVIRPGECFIIEEEKS